MSENNVLPVILAGGKSRRFGGNKANAKLGDLTLIDHTIQKLKNRFKEILIISNEESNKIISNVFLLKRCYGWTTRTFSWCAIFNGMDNR